jgi:hypothetical protein
MLGMRVGCNLQSAWTLAMRRGLAIYFSSMARTRDRRPRGSAWKCIKYVIFLQ